MDPYARKHLSIKTKLEMARGALGHAVDKEGAEFYINQLVLLNDGERRLAGLCAPGWKVYVRREHKMSGAVIVRIVPPTPPGNDPLVPLELTDPYEGFPSGELVAKVMLVAG